MADTHDENFKPDLSAIANEDAVAQAQIAAVAEEEKAVALAEAIRVIRDHKKKNKLEFFTAYKWQMQFYEAGTRSKQRALMAANRVGKSYSAAYEMACHLTGKYPDWWPGIKFSGRSTHGRWASRANRCAT